MYTLIFLIIRRARECFPNQESESSRLQVALHDESRSNALWQKRDPSMPGQCALYTRTEPAAEGGLVEE